MKEILWVWKCSLRCQCSCDSKVSQERKFSAFSYCSNENGWNILRNFVFIDYPFLHRADTRNFVSCRAWFYCSQIFSFLFCITAIIKRGKVVEFKSKKKKLKSWGGKVLDFFSFIYFTCTKTVFFTVLSFLLSSFIIFSSLNAKNSFQFVNFKSCFLVNEFLFKSVLTNCITTPLDFSFFIISDLRKKTLYR